MNNTANNEIAAQSDWGDPAVNVPNIDLAASACYVTIEDQEISTVLGSCVAVCMRDPVTGAGGMNHFMLPNAAEPALAATPAALRYGPNAMNALITSLCAAGARLERLEAKVFGGGQVLASLSQSRIGAANIECALGDLAARGIPIVAQDVGGGWPRRVHYRPATGQARVRRFQRMQAGRFDPATGTFLRPRRPIEPAANSRRLP